MNDFRVFLLELLSFSRKSARSPESVLSSASVTVIVFGITSLILLAAPVFMTRELALLFVYGLAIFEVLLGLRVGLLRIGQSSSEQLLPITSRFWKKSFPYLLPALLIPLPLTVATTGYLSSTTVGWWVTIIALISNYLMFLFLGMGWSLVIRAISKKSLPRILLLLLSTVLLFGTLSSGDFVFRALLLTQGFSQYAQLILIIAQLSIAALLISLSEIALGNLSLSTDKRGEYWPIFLTGKSAGYGQGSSSFFQTNKAFLRSSALHRRLSALILSLLLFMLTLYAILFVGGAEVSETVILTVILTFTAVSSLLISRRSADIARQRLVALRHLPVFKSTVLTGSWLAGLLWQVGAAVIFWGVVSTWINTDPTLLWVIVVGALTQHTLFFGWAGKLHGAVHHNLALFAVFALAVLLGLLPILILTVSGISQTIVVQLIWLGSIGILLHSTTKERRLEYA